MRTGPGGRGALWGELPTYEHTTRNKPAPKHRSGAGTSIYNLRRTCITAFVFPIARLYKLRQSISSTLQACHDSFAPSFYPPPCHASCILHINGCGDDQHIGTHLPRHKLPTAESGSYQRLCIWKEPRRMRSAVCVWRSGSASASCDDLSLKQGVRVSAWTKRACFDEQ